jgi:acyl-CoA reductase-like NAD-dependent aldehyde dehydrogenase
VLIHESYDIALAAERVAVGKLFNGGQTCIAPDYALVPAGKEAVFADAFREAARRLWAGGPSTAMASDKGLERMRALLEDAKSKGARCEEVTLAGGAPRAMSPVLVFGVEDDMRIMQEEIFGPLLPVLTYRTEAEALARIDARPNPLAVYVFDGDVRRAEALVRRVSCGDACINDTLGHFAQEGLPFGGIGGSGTGQYHGRSGFETFSHSKGVLVANPLSPGRAFYAPTAAKLVDRAMGVIASRFGRWLR